MKSLRIKRGSAQILQQPPAELDAPTIKRGRLHERIKTTKMKAPNDKQKQEIWMNVKNYYEKSEESWYKK